MNSTFEVVGYRRVSTIDQGTDGFGLQAQEKSIRQACRIRGWSLVALETDLGESGKTLDRPALRSALNKVAAGDAGGLVVAKLDRLSRSVVDFASLLTWFTESGRALVALDIGVDTSGPSGRLVATVMASVAQWERETIGIRTKEGLRAARASGKPISRPSLADNPKLAEKVRRLRSDGMTLKEVADTLNAEGVPTLRGGKLWRPSAIQSVVGPKRRAASRRSVDFPKAAPLTQSYGS